MDRRAFLRQVGRAAAGLGACAVLTESHGVSAAASARKPNIVFFLIDDMGWMDTHCYGSEFYETPNIDRLAAQGIRFTNAYAACPVCSPTRASILTGKYPARLHLTDWIPGATPANTKLRPPAFRQELPLEEVTLAEALKEAGYVSASIGKWHLGKESFWPEHQGFDVNFAGGQWGHPASYFYPYKGPEVPEGTRGEYLTDRLTDEAVRFIKANKGRPFLLYFPHYAVHKPLQAKDDLIRKSETRVKPGSAQNNAVYAAMIQSVDESVGRILKTLDALDIAEDTVVFFMSDNGGLASVTSNAPLRAGKGTLYEGGIREPMIVRWPGQFRAGRVCQTSVISVDFFPTILELTGLTPAKHTVDGVSFAPLLERGTPLSERALYWHYPHYSPQGGTPGGAIRKGDYKLILFYEDQRTELYNLGNDIGESRDLAAAMPEKAAELRRDLEAWLKAVGAEMPTANTGG